MEQLVDIETGRSRFWFTQIWKSGHHKDQNRPTSDIGCGLVHIPLQYRESRIKGAIYYMQLHPHWEFVADTVMGGVSTGNVTHEIFEGREATVLRGEVSLDNNGGFIQMAFDLCQDGSSVDCSAWDGIQATVWGNSHTYDIRLRTAQLTRPWQSFRTDFETTSEWQTVQIPFASFIAHRVEAVFDPTCLRRVGIVAIGHEISALVAVSSIGFYSAS